MRSKLTTIILISMVLGILVGWACHELWPDPKTAKSISDYISLFTDIFLRLIKMIIAPLVFSTLVVGVAHMGDTKAVGRIGAKAMLWFVGASLVSLLHRPDAGQHPAAGRQPQPAAARRRRRHQPQGLARSSLKEFMAHLVPRSRRRGDGHQRDPADRRVLAVLRRRLPRRSATRRTRRRAGIEELVARHPEDDRLHHGARADRGLRRPWPRIVTTQGLGILVTYGKFMLEFYFGLAVLWGMLTSVGFLHLRRGRRSGCVSSIREPFLLAFSTASSEAAYPNTMEQLPKFRISQKIISFVLPLGYSFNLDGSMMYCTFAVMFIAQAYNIELSTRRSRSPCCCC